MDRRILSGTDDTARHRVVTGTREQGAGPTRCGFHGCGLRTDSAAIHGAIHAAIHTILQRPPDATMPIAPDS